MKHDRNASTLPHLSMSFYYFTASLSTPVDLPVDLPFLAHMLPSAPSTLTKSASIFDRNYKLW